MVFGSFDLVYFSQEQTLNYKREAMVCIFPHVHGRY